MSDQKLSGLSEYSYQKKQSALLKTEQAITKLSLQEEKITIRAVAREAGVSVSYIYKYPELAYKIQQLREQQKYSLIKSDRRNKNPQQQIHQLQQEKAKLAQEISELRAVINRQATSKTPPAELEIENSQLRIENQQLKEELKYTLRNLQEAREFILAGEKESQSEKEIL